MRIEFEDLAENDVVVATHAMRVSRIQGFFNGAANRWLQLHDAKATPADTAVPLRVWPLYATAPFDWNFQNDPIGLVNGCVLVVSSTQATLTISADTMDIYVNGVSHLDLTGASVAGDYTTSESNLEVWNQAAGEKTLLRLEFTSLTDAGVAVYAKIFANADSLAAGDLPILQITLPRQTSVDKWFDTVPRHSENGSLFKACVIVIENVSGVYAEDLNADYAIKATYR